MNPVYCHPTVPLQLRTCACGAPFLECPLCSNERQCLSCREEGRVPLAKYSWRAHGLPDALGDKANPKRHTRIGPVSDRERARKRFYYQAHREEMNAASRECRRRRREEAKQAEITK